MLMTERRGRGRPRMETRPLTAAQQEFIQIRHQLGWTQEEFAAALGVIPNTVSRWERGERDVAPPTLGFARQLLAQHAKQELPPIPWYERSNDELTPQERRELARSLAEHVRSRVIDHIDTYYPAMWDGVATTARTSVRNTIYREVLHALAIWSEEELEDDAEGQKP